MLFKLFTILLILVNTNVLQAQFLECYTEADCIAKSATCKDNICYCPKGQVFSTDHSNCLPLVNGYQSDCEDDNQCSWMLGKSACIDRKCQCDKGWRFYRGKCLRYVALNEPCILHEDCYNGYDVRAMVCTNNKCSCNSDGYYLRGNYDCRPQSNLKEYCSLTSDCIGNAVCNGSFCVNPSKLENRSLVTINLHDKEDTSKVNLDKNKTRFTYNEPCNNNEECSKPNTFCYSVTKKCTCKRGYFYKSDEDGCVGELGSMCENDKDCKIDYTTCVDGKCYCRKSYFTLPSNAACQKPMTEDNFFCNNNERCYVLGANAVCLNNECSCKVSYELDEHLVCRYSDDFDTCDSCNEDKDCTEIINSKCIKNQCQCPENYRLEKKICLPNLGALCSSTIPCEIKNSNCIDETCKCNEGFVTNNSLSCLEMSYGLGTDCLENIQCSTVIENSKCGTNLTCICNQGYQSYNNACFEKKYMHDTCTTSTQCNVMLDNNVECKNGKCQCPIDMKTTEDKLGCQRSFGLNLNINQLMLILVISNVIKSSLIM